jgi:hypothetical protein
MDLELLGSLGWREGLIAIIALLLALHHRPLFPPAPPAAGALPLPPLAAQSAVAAYTAIQEPDPPAALRRIGPRDRRSAGEGNSSVAGCSPESPRPFDAGKPEFPWNEPPPRFPGRR